MNAPIRAIVLGAGIAGLAAAEGLNASGVHVESILTRPSREKPGHPMKSELYGAQFLHEPFRGSRVRSGNGELINYVLRGEPGSYQAKVYPNNPVPFVSPERFPDGHQSHAWDIRDAYDQLWSMWRPYMHINLITPEFLHNLLTSMRKDDKAVIVSTIPRTLLCDNKKHTFHTQNIWGLGDSSAFRFHFPDGNAIIMNAEEYPSWYRAARIFGHTTFEWPYKSKPPVEGVAPVRKPISHDCTCWPDSNLHFLGRYGSWCKGYLADQVYRRAWSIGRVATNV